MDKKNHRQSEYWLKRKRIFKIFLITVGISFLASLVSHVIHDETGIKLFEYIGKFGDCVVGLVLILLIPICIYARYLKLKAMEEMQNGEEIIGNARRVENNQIGNANENRTSWASVFLWMIAFPPVGLLYLVYKLSTEPTYYLDNSIVCKSFGIVLFMIGLAAAAPIRFMPDNVLFYVMGINAVSGLIAIIASMVFKKKGFKYLGIRNSILLDGVVKIDDLARIHNMNYGDMIRDIDFMINNKLIYRSYINFHEREVKCPVDLPKIAVRCPKCTGTTIMIQGFSGVCDYCGKVLK